MQQEIKNIHDKYPWASDATLTQALNVAGKRNDMLKRMVKETLDIDLDDLINQMEKADQDIKGLRSAGEYVGDTIDKSTKGFLSTLQSTNDPLTSAAAMMELGAGALDDAGGAIAGLVSKVPRVGPILGLLASGSGKAAVVGAATAAAFAKIASQQIQLTKSMIDLGYITADLDVYNTIRTLSSNIGMSLEEFVGETQGLMGMFARDTRGIDMASADFSLFLSDVQSLNESGVIPNYGYSPKEIASRMIEEAEQLYMLGEITTLDNAAKQKIIQNFMLSSETASYLSNQLNDQRSALLASRDEIGSNLDLRRAFIVNATELADVYGESSETLLRDRFAIVNALNNSVFGNGDFSSSIVKSFTNFVGNFQFDQTMANDIEPVLRDTINRLEVMPDFIKLTETLENAQSTPTEILQAQNDFIRAISKAESRALTSEDRTIVAQAQASLALLPNANQGYISSTLDTIRANLDSNSESVQVVGDFQIAYARMRDTMEPSFETIAGSVKTLENALRDSIEIMGEVFGIDVDFRTTREKAEAAKQATMDARNRVLDAQEGMGSVSTGGDRQAEADRDTIERFTKIPENERSPVQQGQLTEALRRERRREPPPEPYIEPGKVMMRNQGATRNKPLDPKLMSILTSAAEESGLDIVVFSGGQDGKGQGSRRTGSIRHDHGMAADIWLYDGDEQLRTDVNDKRLTDFITLVTRLGARGIGAGDGYMGSLGVHVDLLGDSVPRGSNYWGAGNSVAATPSYVRDAYYAGKSSIQFSQRMEDVIKPKSRPAFDELNDIEGRINSSIMRTGQMIEQDTRMELENGR